MASPLLTRRGVMGAGIDDIVRELASKDAAIEVLVAENKKLWEIVDRLKKAANNDSHQYSKCCEANYRKATKHYKQSWHRLAGIIKGRAYTVNDGICHFPRDDGEL